MSGPTCPGCGTQPPPGARFCPTCGRLQAAATPAGERRVVTVVFADLAGFTAMAEGRDPEAVKELLDSCFGVLVPVIEAHGGTVDKIIGDELMAVFGAPRTHEDDPERAVRAALALLEALDRLDPTLEMRIGINTGEVLAGPVGPGGAATVTGDTVNTAHRLVGVAATGRVLVGERTYLLTHHAIRYDPPVSHSLRGRQEDVLVYAAQGTRRRPSGRGGPAGAPLIGRAEELRSLVHLVSEAEDDHARRLVTVIGEAGVGKSRLVDELPVALRAADVPARVLITHCAAYGGEGPLAPLARVVGQVLGIDLTVDVALDLLAMSERLRRLPALAGADHRYLAHRLLQLLVPATSDPSDGPPGLRRSTGELVRAAWTVVGAVVEEDVLVIVFDDAHFAGDDLLDQVWRFGTAEGDDVETPAVLVVVGRDDLADRRPDLVREVGTHHRVVHLGPLGSDASGELVHRTLAALDDQEGTLAEGAVADIVQAAGGNPLLLEQLVRYLREIGALEVVEGGWRLVGVLDDAGLPDGARALLGARLDTLPPEERRVLQGAAVVGQTFSTAVLTVMGIDAPPAILASLEKRGLLWRIGGIGDVATYVFRHAMVRDAAYASVQLSDRAARHALVARWLLDRAEPNGGHELGAIAHHMERAVSLGAELGHETVGLAPEAGASLLGAARAARGRDEHREAERWYRRCLDLDLCADEDVVAVHLEHGAVLLTLRRLVDAAAAYRAALALADDPAVEAAAATGLGVVTRLLGDAAASSAHFAHGLRAWRRTNDRLGEATGLRTQGWAELVVGRPGAALPLLVEARELEAAVSEPSGATLQCLAWCDFQLGNHASARRHLWAAGQALFASEDRLELNWCFAILGNSLWQEGRVDQAEALARNLIDAGRRLGDLWGEGACLVLLGECLLEAGDVAGARERAITAIRTFAELEDPWGDATARLLLGMVERTAGDLTAARAALERGLERADQVGAVGAKARLRAELAATLLDRGHTAAAITLAEATLEQVRSGGGDRDSEIRALVVLAKQARDAGDLRLARRHLDEAVGLADGEVLTSIWRRAMAWSAIVAAETGDVDRAVTEARAASDGAWESARTWVIAQRAVAAAAVAAGDEAGASATLDAVIGRFRDRPLAFLDAVRHEVRALQESPPR